MLGSYCPDFWQDYPGIDGKDDNLVGALVHGLGILRLLGLRHGGLSLAQITEETGLSKTTAFRLLATLVRVGHVTQDPVTKLYSLDYSFLELAGLMLVGAQARSRAGPYLLDLAIATGMSAVLSVLSLSQSATVVIDRAVPRGVSSRQSEIGAMTPAHASANGKSILAFLPEVDLEAYLERVELRAFTERTITDKARLRAELAEARSRGYALNDEEWIPRLRSVGAPIRNYNGDVIAAVGVSNHEILPEGFGKGIGEVLQFVPTVLEAAERISYSLGYHAAYLV